MKSKVEFVLDASALLASLFAEPGHERVDGVLSRSAITAVNLTEVITKFLQRGGPVDRLGLFEQLGLKVLPWTAELAMASADLSYLGWTQGLSVGDRVCLAAGRSLSVPVLTTDRRWGLLGVEGVRVELV